MAVGCHWLPSERMVRVHSLPGVEEVAFLAPPGEVASRESARLARLDRNRRVLVGWVRCASMLGSCVYRLEDDRRDLARLLVQGEVSGVGNLDDAHVRTRFEHAPLLVVVRCRRSRRTRPTPARRNRKIVERASRGGRGSRDTDGSGDAGSEGRSSSTPRSAHRDESAASCSSWPGR